MSASAYWNMLFRDEPAEAFAEVRYRPPTGAGMLQDFFSVRDCEAAFERIEKLGRETEVFIGVAPRKVRRGARDAVDHLHVLWADCDTRESVRELNAYTPKPSMIVASGRGFHPYWSMRDPVDPDTAERANRRIAQEIGADMASTDAARILRPPGTFNHKRSKPQPVEIRVLEAEAVYTVEEVVGYLPEQAERAPRPTSSEGDDFIATQTPAEYLKVLAGVEVTPGVHIRCPLPDHEDRTPSFLAYESAERGWYCFGCRRGGGIYQLAAGLAGMWRSELRGVEFLAVEDGVLKIYERRFGI